MRSRSLQEVVVNVCKGRPDNPLALRDHSRFATTVASRRPLCSGGIFPSNVSQQWAGIWRSTLKDYQSGLVAALCPP